MLGGGGLEVPVALVGAEVDALALQAAGAGAEAGVAFEGAVGAAGDEVDGATEGVRTVEGGAHALGDLDGGEVAGGEAVEVDVAVVGDVHGDAVDEDRHLAGVEATQADGAFVAGVGAGADAAQQVEGVGDGVALEALHVAGVDRGGDLIAEVAGLAGGGADQQFAQAEDLAGGVGRLRREDGAKGTQGQEGEACGEKVHGCSLCIFLYSDGRDGTHRAFAWASLAGVGVRLAQVIRALRQSLYIFMYSGGQSRSR